MSNKVQKSIRRAVSNDAKAEKVAQAAGKAAGKIAAAVKPTLEKAKKKAPGWVKKYVKKEVEKGRQKLGSGVQAKLHPRVSLGVVSVQGLARGSVQVALRGTPGHAQLVDSDRRRQLHEATTGETWVKAEGELGGGLHGSLSGLSIGMTKDVKASFIGAYPLKGVEASASSAVNAAHDALKVVVLPTNAETLKSFKWAPGSELALTNTKHHEKAVNLSGPSMLSGALYVSPTAGGSHSQTVTHTKLYKHVGERRGDNRYFMQLGQFEQQQRDRHVGVATGIAIPFSVRVGAPAPAPVSTNPPPEAPPSFGVGGVAGKTLSGVIKTPALASLDLGRTKDVEHRVLANAVFNLDDPRGVKAFDTINGMKVDEAADYIRKNAETLNNGAVAVVDGAAKTNRVVANVIGKQVLFASDTKGDRSGVVWREGEGETKLKEKYVAQKRSGFFYRLINEGAVPRAFGDGIERSVEVSAGTIQRPGQQPTTALQVALDVKDAKLLPEEVAEWQRFAQGMGASLDVTDHKKFGAATVSVGAAYEQRQLDALIALAKRDPNALMGAIARAQSRIEGNGEPPWASDPATMDKYVAQLNDNLNPESPQARSDYRWDFKGRDLDRDKSAYETAKAVVKAMAELTPGDLEGMSHLLGAVGKQYSRDVRNVMLAFKDAGGGTLTKLDVASKKGGAFSAKAQVAGQDRLNVEVDRLMAPPPPDAVEAQ